VKYWINNHLKLFYLTELDFTNIFLEKNLPIIEKNYKLFPNRNKWNCNCHVIHDNDLDVEPIDFKFLKDNYTQIIKNFVNEFYKDKDFFLSDIWYNYYKEGQYQESHTHDSTFTAVHFILFNSKEHANLEFTDKEINKIKPIIKQNDFLIFPGQLEHYVPKNKNKTPRLTVAFGISLKDKKNL
jgi:hypothetical protein